MIHLKFIGFNAIKFLQSENIFVLTKALRYHKQLSTSLIVVGDIIISKSFDKLVKARDVKVSTERWCDGSQTQRYGGSGTGLTPHCVAESDQRHAQHPLKMLGINFSCDSYQTNSERIMLLNSLYQTDMSLYIYSNSYLFVRSKIGGQKWQPHILCKTM